MSNLNLLLIGPMKLFSESNSAISIVHIAVQHNKTKHVRIDRNFIKFEVESGAITLYHISTKFKRQMFL